MNKKVIIVAVLLLLGLAGYFGYQRFMGGNTGGNETKNTKGMQSLKDLLLAGVPQKCTFSSEGSTGTTFVASGKVRGDFTSTVSGKATNTHMISDGSNSYIWTDGEANGFKMDITANSTSSTPDYADNSGNSQADLDQKMDYNCTAWIADNSFFTPPSNVTFTDFSQMYAPVATSPSQQGAGSSDPSSTCAYCNALTGDDKAQCLAALNCN